MNATLPGEPQLESRTGRAGAAALLHSRRLFGLLNKYFMVPMFRLGLGPFTGNPYTGYIMVLKTTGRKSGKTRYTPVNYAISGGRVYFAAGFGRRSDWYLNLRERPQAEVILPGGAFSGEVEEVSDTQEKVPVLRQLLVNAGFAGYFSGYSPRRISDDTLHTLAEGYPLLKLTPTGIGSGPGDPGGLQWVWGVVITLWAHRAVRSAVRMLRKALG